MAVTAKILKKTQQQAVIKFVAGTGGGSGTVTLANLKVDSETIDFANVPAQVNITSAYFATDANVTVSRGGNVVLVLAGQDNWTFSDDYGFTVSEDNGSDITANFGTGTGTCILTLTKAAGFEPVNEQILQPRDR